MHIALAPFTLKHGVTEETLLKTSDEFETSFVRTQDGIHRRILVQDTEGATPTSSSSRIRRRRRASWRPSRTATSARRSSRS
jgi:hypothetical protein